jgi:hypothetical protein
MQESLAAAADKQTAALTAGGLAGTPLAASVEAWKAQQQQKPIASKL